MGNVLPQGSVTPEKLYFERVNFINGCKIKLLNTQNKPTSK